MMRLLRRLFEAVKPKEHSYFWHEGNAAYYAGKNIDSCPYTRPFQWRKDEWLDGFRGK